MAFATQFNSPLKQNTQTQEEKCQHNGIIIALGKHTNQLPVAMGLAHERPYLYRGTTHKPGPKQKVPAGFF